MNMNELYWIHRLYVVSPQLANAAGDLMVRMEFKDRIPDGLNEKYRGWDSAAIYHDLKTEQEVNDEHL